MGALKQLCAFFVVGALIVLVTRGAARPALTVALPAGMPVEAAIDDALLVELGLGLGWQSDPIIVARVVSALTASGVDGDRATLLARAEALDLPRRDPLVRARLVAAAERWLGRVATPSEATLEAYRVTHAARFVRPARYRFEHDWSGQPDLRMGRTGVRGADVLGQDVVDAPLGTWVTRGDQRYRVVAVIAPELPALPAIHAEVLGAWREEQQAKARADGLRRLRVAVDVHVQVIL